MAGKKQLAAALALALAVAACAAALMPAAEAFDICGVRSEDLIGQCQQYVGETGPKAKPSPACCGVVKKVDISCLCSKLPPGIGATVRVKKAVYVADFCGNPIPQGSQCGDINVPPSAH